MLSNLTCVLIYSLKLTNHCVLHYLWSGDLLNNLMVLFSIDYVNIYLLSRSFSIDWNAWGYSTLPTSWFIKSDSHRPQKIIVFASSAAPKKSWKMLFISSKKVPFVLKIFPFLSWLFCHVGKKAWLGI